jgi:hypothetical protein
MMSEDHVYNSHEDESIISLKVSATADENLMTMLRDEEKSQKKLEFHHL